MNFFLDMLQRLRTESPKFFVVLRWLAGILAIIATAVKQVIADEVWQPAMANKIEIVCGYVITAAMAIWGTSFLAKKDAEAGNTPKVPILIFALCLAGVMAGCGSGSKTSSASKVIADSSSFQSAVTAKLATVDSSILTKQASAQRSLTDSGYSRITVTKEFFLYPYDFLNVPGVAGEIPAKGSDTSDPVRSKKLLYKETTTTETGNLKRAEENTGQTESVSAVKKTAGEQSKQVSAVKVTNINEQSFYEKHREGLISVSVILLLAALVIAAYIHYKK